MRDRESFESIAESKHPSECKALGRGVYPWNEELWQKFVCAIAKDVIFAKFGEVEGFRERLLDISEFILFFQSFLAQNHRDSQHSLL